MATGATGLAEETKQGRWNSNRLISNEARDPYRGLSAVTLISSKGEIPIGAFQAGRDFSLRSFSPPLKIPVFPAPRGRLVARIRFLIRPIRVDPW
jgi:hypothetical protein